MSERAGGRLLVDQLVRHGVERAYCVPGESYLSVLDALYDEAIQLVVCRHEGGAAYMAEASGRLTGRPGVCFVTRAPGAANAMPGICMAAEEAVPMLLFVGLVPRALRDREAFQDIDVRAVYGSVAKRVLVIDQAAAIPEQIAKAFAATMAGRPGPVVVGLPEDMLLECVEVHARAPYVRPDPAINKEELRQLQDLVVRAERPLVVVGGTGWTPQVARGVDEWAQRWGLPVATSFRCQDYIDNESPSYIGPLGLGRSDYLAAALREADLIVSVGAGLGDVTTDHYEATASNPRQRIVLVSPHPEPEGGTAGPVLHVLARPAAFATAIRDLPSGGAVPWQDRTKQAREAYLESCQPPSIDAELHLGQALRLLADRLPTDSILTYGAGNYAIWPQRFWTYRAYPSQLAPRTGAMGYGVPAGIAAALQYPERQVVTLAGDGCLLMNGQELATAVSVGAHMLVLVANNAMYGTIRKHQELDYPGRVVGTDLSDVDFASYARGLGAHGYVVTQPDELPATLDRALASGGVALIDLRVSHDRLTPEMTIADARRLGRRRPPREER